MYQWPDHGEEPTTGWRYNQMRARPLIRHAVWYNGKGKPFGMGDLNLHDLQRVAARVEGSKGAMLVLAPSDAIHVYASSYCFQEGLAFAASRALYVVLPTLFRIRRTKELMVQASELPSLSRSLGLKLLRHKLAAVSSCRRYLVLHQSVHAVGTRDDFMGDYHTAPCALIEPRLVEAVFMDYH